MDSLIDLSGIVRKKNLLAHLSIWTLVALVLTFSLTVFRGNLFGIIYLVLALSFSLAFQGSYSCWARSIKTFCILLITYSIAVTLLTYSFQFNAINTIYKSFLSDEILSDIGLVVRTNGWILFLEPFVSLLLTILLVIYLKVFHDDFNRFAYLAEEHDAALAAPLTNSQHTNQQQTINDPTFIMLNTSPVRSEDNSLRVSNEESTVMSPMVPEVSATTGHHLKGSRSGSIANPSAHSASRIELRRVSQRIKVKNFIDACIDCFWRILETHFIKLVLFMIFRIPIVDVCLLNLPFLLIAIVALKYPSTSKCSCLTASWLISIVVIIRSLSNLTSFRKLDFTVTCGAIAPQPLSGKTFSYLDYIGVSHKDGNPLNLIDNHIFVLVLITLYCFIAIHYERREVKDYELSFGVIFTGIGRREADLSVVNALKYFCNFGFYKFGVEITCIALIIAISNRLDFVAALFGITLLFLGVSTSKRTLASFWPFLNALVSLIITVEYVLRLGFPRPFCTSYPWESFNLDLKYWFYLSDYEAVPDVRLLLFDFLVLLAVCRQAVVFKHMSMNSSPSLISDYQVHLNLSAHQFRVRYLPNNEEYATEDCFSNYTTQNSYVKSIFFVSIYWITLAVVLAAGATKISLFSLGYLIGCFIFLWLGNDTYLLPSKRLIFNWNWLIFYATLVIFVKVVLQLYTCYAHDYLSSQCYVLQLLRVACYRKINTTDPNLTCTATLPYDELDILWDGLCLVALLMQRVVFGSRYFRYLVLEVKAQQILASRGAELIMATQIEEAKAQNLYEKEVMRSVREKLENLKLDDATISRAWERLLNLPHHHQIIRNADRHLFSSVHDDLVKKINTNDWKFKKAFIPDPLGDELERMAAINGISAVFTRWMKGYPLYGSQGHYRSVNSPEGSRDEGEGLELTAQHPSLPPLIADEVPETRIDEQYKPGAKNEELEDPSNDDESSETDKLRSCWSTLNLVVYSCLLSATVELNKLSRSYRYVSRRMAAEKNILKQQFDLNDERFKRDPAWRKSVISTLSESYTKTNGNSRAKMQSSTSLHRIRSALKIMTSSSSPADSSSHVDQAGGDKHSPGGSSPPQKSSQSRGELADSEYHFLKLNMFTQFCRALAYVFISNTSLLCQLIIIFNQILTASLLSLPLPLLTFLWGTLSVPRPTKRFWKTVITYTELVIVIKYIYQFPLWDWDTNNINPFYYPNLLGIRNITILYDLFLLLALFFHRSMLKSLGQWDATAEQNSLLEQAAIATNHNGDNQYGSTRRKFSSSYSLNRRGTSKTSINRSNYQQDGLTSKAGSSSMKDVTSLGVPDDSPDQMSRSTEIAAIQDYNDYMHDSYQNQPQQLSPNERDIMSNDKKVYSDSVCGKYILPVYQRVHRSISLFFSHVLDTPYKVQTDVYVWMFLCDFINFLILIYGFWAFGSGYKNQTVANFLAENRIPISVLIMLLAQFASIIIDRAFYLQKNIGGKLTFQVILVIGIHFWLFFALPFTTGHTLTLKEYWPPKAWYFFKCIYFLLSALQIRSGYPRRVLGNCFTKSYGYANWGAFKVYRAIPLVYDLRLYMDWIWTETTLEFRNWSIMEDMFATLFIRKCELSIEDEFPNPRAKPLRRISKYLTGGAFILLILAVIWGPLLLFSMGKTVGQSNPPVEMEYELEFVGFQPILRMRATAQQITMINKPQYDALKGHVVTQTAQTFLGDYNVGDVAAIRLDGQSNAVWEISPPSKELLMSRIKKNETLTLKSSWTFLRIKREKSQNFDVNIAGSYQKIIDDSFKEFRSNLYEMLADSATTKTPADETKYVVTPPIFPNYIRVPETGQASLVNLTEEGSIEFKSLRPLHLTYIRVYDDETKMIDNSTSWWKADDICKHKQSEDTYPFWSPSLLEHCDALVTVAFNDKIFTGILAVLSAFGIIGLYTTFVVFFARLIRSEPSGRVIYTEMPKVDRVYGLILDIYMMRECGEFELEEKLFAKLLFLYRSPEMLIDWSRREDELDQLNNDELRD